MFFFSSLHSVSERNGKSGTIPCCADAYMTKICHPPIRKKLKKGKKKNKREERESCGWPPCRLISRSSSCASSSKILFLLIYDMCMLYICIRLKKNFFFRLTFIYILWFSDWIDHFNHYLLTSRRQNHVASSFTKKNMT